MDIFFDPDENFLGQFQSYCQKCGRYYSSKTPHMCYPEDVNVESERRKLKKFLGDYKVIE